jgi:hypothetical protein
LSVTYLLPQRDYSRKHFPGAPEQEGWPTALTVGVGEYELIHRIGGSKLDLLIDQVQLEFDGDGERPVAQESFEPLRVGPIWTDESGRRQFRTWHGVVGTVATDAWPRVLNADDSLLIGHRISTSAEWEGEASLTVMMREANGRRSGTVREPLPFRVSTVPEDDEIPFLRRPE